MKHTVKKKDVVVQPRLNNTSVRQRYGNNLNLNQSSNEVNDVLPANKKSSYSPQVREMRTGSSVLKQLLLL